MDFAEARRFMVDGQLRPNRIEDPRIVSAMRDLPRERFAPPALAARAYADADLPLPGGRAMMQPMVLAKLVQLAGLRRGERALVVAAGTGFGAALMAAIGGSVTAVESDPALLAIAHLLNKYQVTGKPSNLPSKMKVQRALSGQMPVGTPLNPQIGESPVVGKAAVLAAQKNVPPTPLH